MIVWLRISLNFVHMRLDLMRMFRLVQFLWLVWRINFLLILWILSGLIRCGLKQYNKKVISIQEQKEKQYNKKVI
jgi:hypothetical protein